MNKYHKNMTPREYALKSVEKLFDHLDERNDPKFEKTMADWINHYCHYLEREKILDPKKTCSYQRGMVVEVDFGVRLGNELGGPHYAVIVDTKVVKSSGVVTVVPLGSKKPRHEQGIYHRGEILLEDEVQRKILDRIKNDIEICEDLTDEYLLDPSKPINNIDIERRIERSRKSLKKLGNMNKESVAFVGQMTVISKMRILNPQGSRDSLYKVKLSSESMNKIDEQIKMLFTY